MTKEYIPEPVETDSVHLPEELLPLVEDMARNVHEVWAKNRMNDGWTYGAVRDDVAKKHPCLVPYDELPESEKHYDRATSQETLKLILKSGFVISRKEPHQYRNIKYNLTAQRDGVCPNCKKDIDPSWHFCRHCGNKLK